MALTAGCGSGTGNQITITVNRDKCSPDPTCSQLMLKLVAYKVPFPLPCLIDSDDVDLDDGSGTLEDLDLEAGETVHLGAALYCSSKPLCLTCGATRQVKVAEGSHTLDLVQSKSCALDDANFMLLMVTPSSCN